MSATMTLEQLVEAQYHASNELFAARQKLDTINNELIAAMLVEGVTKASNEDTHSNVTLVTRRNLKITNQKEVEAALHETNTTICFKKPEIDKPWLKALIERTGRDLPGAEIEEVMYVTSRGDQQ